MLKDFNEMQRMWLDRALIITSRVLDKPTIDGWWTSTEKIHEKKTHNIDTKTIYLWQMWKSEIRVLSSGGNKKHCKPKWSLDDIFVTDIKDSKI